MNRQQRTECPLCGAFAAIHPNGRLRVHYARPEGDAPPERCPAIGLTPALAYERHLEDIQGIEPIAPALTVAGQT
jgi:hypothetical protein